SRPRPSGRAWCRRCARCCLRCRCSRSAASPRGTCPSGGRPDARAPASAASCTAPGSRSSAPARRRGASARHGWTTTDEHSAPATCLPPDFVCWNAKLQAHGTGTGDHAHDGLPGRDRPGTTCAATRAALGTRQGRDGGRRSTWNGSNGRPPCRRKPLCRHADAWPDGDAMGGVMGAVNVATAELAVDSRCRLGEGIVWDERRGCLYWTDILSARLWMHVPDSGQLHHWDLPEPLGCLALCEDGRLLLALAKSIRLAAAPMPGASLALETLCALEPDQGASTRSNDGRCDRHGNFVFGTKDETGADPPLGRFYQFSAAHGLRPL